MNVPVANLTVTGGVISGGGQSLTYGSLIGGKLVRVGAACRLAAAGTSNMPGRTAGQYLNRGSRRTGEAGLAVHGGRYRLSARSTSRRR